ncbi:hypothetical protein LTR37_002496 [Vermiconidia calcicola]|uniref:Uncharacterized protein n=1 Tax=Vermiconidia calcicola TaxID=1690605 RepID=A0ACC3NT49_9PEZI|nr:hypothetical protein LTR37_002496 [Vermiconidia calcicola]
MPTRSVSLDSPTQLVSATVPSGSQQHSLNRTAFEVDSEAVFLNRYLPQDEVGTVYIGGITTAPWTQTVLDLAKFDDTSRIALDALALTILGHAQSDQALLQESTRLYGKALRETNTLLQDPIKAQSDAVLGCCKTLALYEKLRVDTGSGVSTQGQDWHQHVEGTCKIVELRGPAKHVSHHGKTLFEDVRVTAVISAIMKRRPNFFTSREWHTIPWQASTRSLHDELCDLMIALPDLLHSQDKLSERFSDSTTNRDRFEILTEGQNLINRCIRLGESLREWEQKALLACVSGPAIPLRNLTGPPTLLEICRDHGYFFFNIVMQYWASCVILYGATWVIYRSVSVEARPDQPPSLPAWIRLRDIPEWTNPRIAASNIVSCVPHFFAPNAGYWGAQSAAFPMGAALHFYAATGGEEEVRRLKQLFKEASLGCVTSGFLRSVSNTADTHRGDPAKDDEHRQMAVSWFGR